MGSPTSALEKIIDAFSKANESQNKLKTEIVKQQIRSNYAQNAMKERLQYNADLKAQELRMKQQTPQQQYWQRLANDQNPIMAYFPPPESKYYDPSGRTIMYDAEKIEPTPEFDESAGLYKKGSQTEEQRQGKLNLGLGNLAEKIRQSGRTPSQWMLNAERRGQEVLNKRLGFERQSPSELKGKIDYLESLDDTEENRALLEETRQEYEQALRIQRNPRMYRSTQGMSQYQEQNNNQDSSFERQIQDDMQYWGKTREEIIQAYRDKGLI